MTEKEDIATEALLEFLNAAEAGIAAAKQRIKEAKISGSKPAVREETFSCLTFEKQTGARIGEYEIAYREQNLPEKWNPAYNVLRQNNAVINARYHGFDYEFSYWLYNEKIFRQKLKPKKESP